MARCPHNRVQQFTECCMDCGRNVYESDNEYYEHLLEQKAIKDRNTQSDKIERLEKELGISHPGNNQKPKCDHNCGNIDCACGGYCQTW